MAAHEYSNLQTFASGYFTPSLRTLITYISNLKSVKKKHADEFLFFRNLRKNSTHMAHYCNKEDFFLEERQEYLYYQVESRTSESVRYRAVQLNAQKE